MADSYLSKINDLNNSSLTLVFYEKDKVFTYFCGYTRANTKKIGGYFMEEKRLAEVVHLAKEDEEEAITELLRRSDPLIMSIHHHYFS